jgi:predicted nucleic acid-binding protein
MSGEQFTLDTNILIYSVDLSAGSRHETAKFILRRAVQCSCYLTLQSISEFYAATTRKKMMPVSDAARVASDMMAVFPMVPGSASAIRAALASASAGTASYWDALLVATAAEAGCTTILTEDMGHGTVLQGVRILNPFAADGLTQAAEALLSTD